MKPPKRITVRRWLGDEALFGAVFLCCVVNLNTYAGDSVAIFSKGDPVPSAGIDPEGAPAGARFSGFGIPAINDAGQVAFVGKWKSPTGNGAAIFVDTGLWARVGFVTGLGPGLEWKSFNDPMLTATGDLLFAGTVTGDHVTAGNDSVIMTTAGFGNLHMIAREGEQPPDAPCRCKMEEIHQPRDWKQRDAPDVCRIAADRSGRGARRQ
jgi:hypothetical protein